MHCFGQSEQAFFAAVSTENARERSPQAGVRMSIVGKAVGADHGGWMRKDAAHVVFRDAVIDGARGLQSPRGFELRYIPGLRNLLERLSCNFRMRRAPGNRDFHA